MVIRYVKLSLSILLIVLLKNIHAQVNTEELRKINLQNGIYGSIKFDYTVYKGNSEFQKLSSGLRTDAVMDNFKTFIVLQYQRGTQNKNVFINKGFVHLRGMRKLNDLFTTEVFLQKEFNEFISLKDRNLVGGGLRTPLCSSDSGLCKIKNLVLYVGIGVMWENEEIDLTPIQETNIIRSTNYISFHWFYNKTFNINLVSYYQVDVENLNDYRILSEGSLNFNISDHVGFQTGVNFRYDDEPPLDIKKHDLEILNGIKISF